MEKRGKMSEGEAGVGNFYGRQGARGSVSGSDEKRSRAIVSRLADEQVPICPEARKARKENPWLDPPRVIGEAGYDGVFIAPDLRPFKRPSQ
jgi:hypothetical protein